MERVKKTTAKMPPRQEELSEANDQVRSDHLQKLPSSMTDVQVLKKNTPENRPFPQTIPRAVPESARHPRIDCQRSSNRPVISTTLFKWVLGRWNRSSGTLAILTASAVCGWWNSQLLAATGLGIGAMMLVYRAQSWDWQQLLTNLEQFWDSPSRRLVVAVGSGGLATLGTYMSFSIWEQSQSNWMALSAILQNLGTIAIVVFLVRQVWSQSASKDEAVIDGILADLTDADPVKRLIAVRQMTDLVKSPGFWKPSSLKKSIGLSHTAECFGLMLNQEPEAIVRNALLEGLQTLDSLNCSEKTKSS
ncbi:MAG: hypothetical protein EAZ78_18280 [Oscillatoriales cyanobacterium]|nr:MAG: hypothetical protein EA000_24600 [Oscillatoriales cyanobacterium]TAD97922.1 MAG: hypothetical protein EAZ98_08315 [Oscillatoriales cyanobacterium]TAE05905.1 MAG: hypothetical protein EAZ96_03900 [Oscillatoriales cyanobacterium]TAF01475.1 MAG: hypothetical protein EAZ78_18280 [Oscillatoriales cyanobacterium]TAF43098.1 MAG: hypothetical protein EAZ68_08810 [Oscillatoriales cyanobacterium]